MATSAVDIPVDMPEEESSLLSDENVHSSSSEEDNGHQLPGEIQGILSKWTNYIHGWQERWIILKEGVLSYYRSRNDIISGCRGSISLSMADIQPHEFDELRFDITVNDCVWYLKATSSEEKLSWIEAILAHKVELGYSSDSSLRRQPSVLSLTSATSLASQGSFKKGRELKEKLAEMETFRDILCDQVDTLQTYFDGCAEGDPNFFGFEKLHGKHISSNTLEDNYSDEESGDFETPRFKIGEELNGHESKDRSDSLPPLPTQMRIDFKGEAYAFKETTSAIISTMAHCVNVMKQREEQWRRRVEKEQEKKRKIFEEYRALKVQVSDFKKKPPYGPDYEEGPFSKLTEEEFFDAVQNEIDMRESEDNLPSIPPLTSEIVENLEEKPVDSLRQEIERKVEDNLRFVFEDIKGTEGIWSLLWEDNDMKVYRREQEIDGIVVDPLKATCNVKKITAHEICGTFFDEKKRLKWNMTLDRGDCIEKLDDNTMIFYELVKRVWPATQRDCLYCSHIRKISEDNDPGSYIVCNFSIEHPDVPIKKCVRAKIDIALFCQTIIDPPAEIGKKMTRDNITCKITYTAHVNPGGWLPAPVLRNVYKREYPRFLQKFTQYVLKDTEGKPILW